LIINALQKGYKIDEKKVEKSYRRIKKTLTFAVF